MERLEQGGFPLEGELTRPTFDRISIEARREGQQLLDTGKTGRLALGKDFDRSREQYVIALHPGVMLEDALHFARQYYEKDQDINSMWVVADNPLPGASSARIIN